MKIIKSTLSLAFAFLSVIAVMLIPYSCKKIKDIEASNPPQEDLVQKFFKVPENTSDALKKVITNIKRQDDEIHFVTSIANKYGFPIWDKSFANTKIRNVENGRVTDGNLEIFLIPFRGADSSVTSYLLCSNHDGDFAYRYYKREELSHLYAANDSIKRLRMGLLGVFGYFEETINHEDSTLIGGIYETTVRNVSISIENSLTGGRVTDVPYTLVVCWDGLLPARVKDELPTICFNYYVWNWTIDDMTWENYGVGGGGGIGNLPDGYYCPNGEWWCTMNEFREINGLIYTPESYPGINDGYPWLWWENASWIYANLGVDFDGATRLWLFNNITRVIEIKNYITSSNNLTLSERQAIVSQHVNLMISNSDYLSFVESHMPGTNPPIVWWEDDVWVNNPANFNLDLVQPNNPNYELTAAEKALIVKYPIQAFHINENVIPSIEMANNVIGINSPNSGHNDKNDAFRHGYFNAINTWDCPPNLVPYRPASHIVKLFSDAHESEVPSQLTLERQMDIFNSDIGIDYCWNCFFTSDDAIATAILQKLNNGELRYLKPLNHNDVYWEIGPDGTKRTATNGITPLTILTPTDQ